MAKLTKEMELRRQAQAVEVLALLIGQPSLTQQQACDQVGISPAVYRHWVRNSPEVTNAIRKFTEESHKEQLAELIQAKLVIIENLTSQMASPEAEIGEMVTGLRYLDTQIDELQRMFHARPGVEQDAQKFLREGPQIAKQRSRLASVEVERTSEGVTVSVYDEHDVIDITPSADE